MQILLSLNWSWFVCSILGISQYDQLNESDIQEPEIVCNICIKPNLAEDGGDCPKTGDIPMKRIIRGPDIAEPYSIKVFSGTKGTQSSREM